MHLRHAKCMINCCIRYTHSPKYIFYSYQLLFLTLVFWIMFCVFKLKLMVKKEC